MPIIINDKELLGASPESPHSVESRITAALPNGDARTGESHITCQNLTNHQGDARYDVTSLQEDKHSDDDDDDDDDNDEYDEYELKVTVHDLPG